MDDMEIYRALGQTIAAKRGKLGLTQATVGARIGLTRASVANIETGRQKVLLHHVYRLAAVLELQSVGDLLPDIVPSDVELEPLPIDASSVTAGQRLQVENAIRLAVSSEPRKS